MNKRWLIMLAGLLMAAVVIMAVRYRSASTLTGYQSRPSTTNPAGALQFHSSMDPKILLAFAEGFRRRDTRWSRYYLRRYPNLPAVLQRRLSPPKTAPAVWEATASGLMSQSGDVRPVLPNLMQMLAEKNNPARMQILSAANRLFDGRDSEYVPVLMSLLQDTNLVVRCQAMGCLERIGPPASAAIPALTEATTNRDVFVRVSAAKALWRTSGNTNVATSVMREAMKSGEKWPALHLHEMDPTDVSLIPVFIEMLNGRDYNLRVSSAQALGEYGSAASAAVPALVEAIESKKSYLRGPALRSLKKIDPATAAKYDNP